MLLNVVGIVLIVAAIIMLLVWTAAYVTVGWLFIRAIDGFFAMFEKDHCEVEKEKSV